jgi:hypothetical protein
MLDTGAHSGDQSAANVQRPERRRLRQFAVPQRRHLHRCVQRLPVSVSG